MNRSRIQRALACAGALTTLVALISGAPAPAQGVEELFPQPFVVEHHLVQHDADGSTYVGETVTTSYGGTRILSERPDGSRLIVDLRRQELTEIHTEKGSFWRLSFSRFAELRSRFFLSELGRDETVALRAMAEQTSAARAAKGGSSQLRAAGAELEEEEIVVTEVGAQTATATVATAAPKTGSLAAAEIRQLRVDVRGSASGGMDVWVDSRISLSAAALRALEEFENTALSTPELGAGIRSVSPGRLLAAARAHAGAFPVRTVRALAPAAEGGGGRLEDVVTRLERLATFPAERVAVPEGFREIRHPLEQVLAVLDSEEGREAWLGNPTSGDRRPE